mmetsp:Transcript_80891/g.251128  ORF Transcript_80891/g.251128 Transcript_80891/m.251128 type:complete len:198 (+) Transcript_80891:119-712(+)
MGMLGTEDHSLAQYWYSPSTLKVLTELCCHRERVGLLSTPSVYFALDSETREKTVLYEFDAKWQAEGVKFRFFDYKAPISDLGSDSKGTFDLIIADPPSIMESVVEKYMQVVHFLLAPGGSIAFTSAMEHEYYFATRGLFARNFVPKESAALAQAGRFRLYTNFCQDCLEAKNDEDFPPGAPDDDDYSAQHFGWGYE